jgi:PEP-CTERM motif
MNSAIAATTLCVAIFCASAAQASGPNVFVNPSFETGSLSPWFADFNSPTVTNTEAHTGSFSVRAFGNDSIRQNFSAVPVGSITELSVWVKHPVGPFFTYYMYYDDSTSNSRTFDNFGASSDWRHCDLMPGLLPGKNLIGFSTFGTSALPAYMDDFVLAVPEPSAVAMMILAASVVTFWGRRRCGHVPSLQ